MLCPTCNVLKSAKERSKKKGVMFYITRADVGDIPDTCPILGIRLERNIGKSAGHRGPTDNSPSLDRIIPEYGYVPGNVRWISHRANKIKQDATADEILSVALDFLSLSDPARANLLAELNTFMVNRQNRDTGNGLD